MPRTNTQTHQVLAYTGIDPLTQPVGSKACFLDFCEPESIGQEVSKLSGDYAAREVNQDPIAILLGINRKSSDVMVEAIKAAGIDDDRVFFEIMAFSDDAHWSACKNCGNRGIDPIANPQDLENVKGYWVATFGPDNAEGVAPTEIVLTRVI